MNNDANDPPRRGGLSLAQAMVLGQLDGHDQAAQVRQGNISAAELTEAALLRIQALDPALGAISHRADEQARTRAAGVQTSGPMAGVPWLVKDSMDYPGMPSRGASRSRSNLPAATAYPFVQRLDAAGLVAIGKSNMPEFGLLGSTEPLLGPLTRNPWAPALSPGGSSGGAAAAVAAGLVPLAHGSDGGGSIRIPAACCGLVGLKPGRDSTVRVRARHAIEDLLVGDSLLSRSVRDVAWGFAATHRDPQREMIGGPDRRRLRIAVIETSLLDTAPHPQVSRVLRRTADLCADLGHAVERVDWPVEGPGTLTAFQDLWTHLGADCVDAVRPTLGGRGLEDALEPWTLALGRRADSLPTSALERIYAQLALLPALFADFHRRHDVLLTPVVNAPPPPLGRYGPGIALETLMPDMFDWIAYTPLQNLAGTPAISLPVFASDDGLPIGCQFAADRGQEDLLLALAYELEAIRPWRQRWPSIAVAT